MAIVNNGTKVNLGSLPTGYTAPVITTFTDHEYERVLTLTVLKATVENADPAVTLANIIANATVGIDKQITDIIAGEFLSTPSVTAYSEMRLLSNNYANLSKSGAYLTTEPAKYIVIVKVYIKSV